MAENYKVIGLMSGTSLDGVDLAYCHFGEDQGKWSYELIETETVEYPAAIREKLKSVLDISGEDLLRLDHELGFLYGQLITDFIGQYGLSAELIASHGHTIFHQPDAPFTYQAGSGSAISISTGLPVVCDFRSQDIMLGGQGAPLVPVGDRKLFSEFSACINLGGIANISFESEKGREAFDICPCNMPLNLVASRMGMEYDKDGLSARSGNVDNELLSALENLEYYEQEGPRSLGYEWVSSRILPLLDESALSNPDRLKTLVEHTARRIADCCNKHRITDSILLTGGGALNVFLVERIRELTDPKISWEIPNHDLVVYKEALIFAFLAVLHQRKEVNVLASVTGASRDHCSGIYYDLSS